MARRPSSLHAKPGSGKRGVEEHSSSRLELAMIIMRSIRDPWKPHTTRRRLPWYFPGSEDRSQWTGGELTTSLSRTGRRKNSRWGAKVNEPGAGCWMSEGQGLADANPQGPEILGAKVRIFDAAGVFGTARFCSLT